MIDKKICVRVAPSPTGDIHIGTLRTALFNWLYARKHGGTFIVRVEDTDQARYKPESVRSIVEGFQWAGLDWDEGPVMDFSVHEFKVIEKGPHGSYFQSQRTALYQEHAQVLLEKGMAYRCFCTTERLEKVRADQAARKQSPMYDKHCCALTEEEIRQKLEQKIPHVIRLKVPASGKREVDDVFKGRVAFELSLVDDQVLIKSDGYPTYHLAVVVDDHAMGVTHVFRGEDWLPSTAKHLLLYEAFGWEKPQFGHLPMILAPDKAKLSKRHGAVSVLALRDLGYLPDALLNFTLLLGWNPGKGSEQEIFSKEEMITLFSLEGIQKSPAIFNFKKLNWMNGQYLKKMKLSALTNMVLPHLLEAGLITPLEAEEWVTADRRVIHRTYLEKATALAQPRLTFAKDIVPENEYFFNEPAYESPLLQWKKKGEEHARTHLVTVREFLVSLNAQNFNLSQLEMRIKEMIQSKGLGMGDVLWPLRAALTGREKSPSPFEVIEVLGKEETIKRVDRAIAQLTST